MAKLGQEFRSRTFAPSVVVLLAVLFLTLLPWALTPHGHHFLHPDSDSTSHHCLLSTFQKGSVFLADTGMKIEPGLGEIRGATLRASTEPMARPDRRLAPPRAPPVQFSIIAG